MNGKHIDGAKNRRRARTAASLILSAAILVSSVLTSASALAAPAEETKRDPRFGLRPAGVTIEVPEYYYDDGEGMLHGASLPAKYDLRDYGRVTSVKNQDPYGSCWAFAAVASAESSLITKGYADKNVDLSEKHLVYFAFANADDRLHNTTGDYTELPRHETAYDYGGNDYFAMFTLAAWEGFVTEETMPYQDFDKTYDDEMAYSYDVYHLDNVTIVPTKSVDYIKKLIMEKGACSTGMYYEEGYMNYETYSYYLRNARIPNHAVTLVGWDDNYSRENFNKRIRPRKNGAWLVKNSWGTHPELGDDGYFWMSYEDASFNMDYNEAVFFECSPVGDDHNIYQYDGGALFYTDSFGKDTVGTANIFTAAEDGEELTRVSFYTSQPNIKYGIQIYTGVNTLPEDGRQALSKPIIGVAPAAGYHSVTLPEPVKLEKDSRFSVVVTVSTDDGSEVNIQLDGKFTYEDGLEHHSVSKAGQSYYKVDGTWNDIYKRDKSAVNRIKCVTRNKPLNTYSVTYKANGGSGAPESQVKTEGVDLKLSDTVPTKGYKVTFDPDGGSVSPKSRTFACTFDGWKGSDGNVYQPGDKYTADSDITLTAKWIKPYAKDLPVPDKNGYAFAGWYGEDGGKVTDKTQITKNTTFKAHWASLDAPHTPGDVNDDGAVDNKDLIRLMKYISGADVAVNYGALDVNGDGTVDNKDLIRLMKYVAGAGVEIN